MQFKSEDIERFENRQSFLASSYPFPIDFDDELSNLDIPTISGYPLAKLIEEPGLTPKLSFRVKPDFLYNDWWKDEPVVWIGQEDGSFVIYIDPAKINEVTKVQLLFSMLSAYRWYVLRTDPKIGSVVFNQSYENFISWVCEKTGESRNTMDHFMYEISPYRNDCVMFACEWLSVSRPIIPSFEITPELLKKLDK